jgi:hypothetical protein
LSGHCSHAAVGGKGLKQPGLRSHYTNLAYIDLDPLSEGAEVVAAIAAVVQLHALASGACESFEHLRRDGLTPGTVQHPLGALSVGLGLVPNGLEAVEPILQRWIA